MRSCLLPQLTLAFARRRLKEQTIHSRLLFHSSVTNIPTSRPYPGPVKCFTAPIYSRLLSTPSTMAGQSQVPYVPQSAEENRAFVQSLTAHTNKRGKGNGNFSCKMTNFPVCGSPQNLKVSSWRLQDWDYKRTDLPTYARGLFTCVKENGEPEIAIRGYDKFFNIGEVTTTKWKHIEQHTRGPYELSLKENGCIIFISGLHDGTLLVCSKHSTGPRADGVSHAVAGEKWIERQLAALGKTRADLAQELRKRNVTAVAELCDDDFEEHILPYTKEAAGLYLHGMNANVPVFTTYLGNQVHEFADQWGFKKVQYLMYDDIASARNFLESVAETGHYGGRDIEGFVIRCKARPSADKPYTDWFFKYKFEEPYLMYRQWREATKSIIAGKQPRFRKHAKATEMYILYAKRRLAADPSLGPAYEKNHGIIGLRNDFLAEIKMKGADLVREEYSGQTAAADVEKDVVLVPIATIGCGKTTIGIALNKLFGWPVIQNDYITGKGRPQKMNNLILDQLDNGVPVVYADRNNSARNERKQIIEDLQKLRAGVHLVALHFAHPRETLDAIRHITISRVIARGDNHQTIQAFSEKSKVLGIMDNFIHRFEPADASQEPDDGFDSIIDLDPTMDSRQNLEAVITTLYNTYPKLFQGDMPTSSELDFAMQYALSEYTPDLKHDVGSRAPPKQAKQENNNLQQSKASAPSKAKKRPLMYVGINLPVTRLSSILTAVFNSAPEKSTFYKQLQETGRIKTDFHVTLIHRASAKGANQSLWDHYLKLHEDATSADPSSKLGDCKVLLERIVWDDRIMAIVVRLVDEREEWKCTNEVAHITVGTRDNDVKPKESNDLLRRWLTVGSGGTTGIEELVVAGRVVLDGIVKGVLSN